MIFNHCHSLTSKSTLILVPNAKQHTLDYNVPTESALSHLMARKLLFVARLAGGRKSPGIRVTVQDPMAMIDRSNTSCQCQ